ncbi:glycoside hydrolase family protein [Geoglobus acetivorans]|uniref:Glycosyl hydrolase family 32 N-terminal domain-containing protein n=1 Tax=Geoglobus acetivorans TaxID=565033 RepID=A0A0A7GDT1_GEOAI|nr:hypothetical protein GACE_1135 [Geoglobus acetivorans]
MKWEKKGLIYKPDGTLWWAKTHAAIPTPVLLDKSTIRIYFASRDRNNVSRIGYIDVDSRDPSIVLDISKEPVLDIGVRGAFDDNGVLPSSIVKFDDKLFLYYIGFQLGVKVRYFLFSGLAISVDSGKSFSRYSRVPILDRSDAGLYFRTAPYVYLESSTDTWHMWYVEGNTWTTLSSGKEVPVYTIKYLKSTDGITWPNEGNILSGFNFKTSDEHGFGRPFILRDGDGYKMFYSIRTKSKGYRIGYAESVDGINWIRKDEEVGIDVSKAGWDSEMICFASIVKVRNKTYMFYNGNNYGETGIGYAVLIKE